MFEATKPNATSTVSVVARGPVAVTCSVPVGGSAVFFGGPDVDVNAGFPLEAGDKWSWDLADGEKLHCVTVSTQAYNRITSDGKPG